jgi:hypothetical protein
MRFSRNYSCWIWRRGLVSKEQRAVSRGVARALGVGFGLADRPCFSCFSGRLHDLPGAFVLT